MTGTTYPKRLATIPGNPSTHRKKELEDTCADNLQSFLSPVESESGAHPCDTPHVPAKDQTTGLNIRHENGVKENLHGN